LHALTAAAEVDFLVSLQPVPVRKRGSVQLEVELTGVLDLSDLSPLASVGIERRELLGPNIDASRLIEARGILAGLRRIAGAKRAPLRNQPGDLHQPDGSD
jgi:hypothetical protein